MHRYITGCATITFLMLGSEIDAKDGDVWERFTDYTKHGALSIKPVTVHFDRRGTKFNGRPVTESDAISLVRKSRELSPLPDVLVRADRSKWTIARDFMNKVNNAGYCEGRKCLYRFIR